MNGFDFRGKAVLITGSTSGAGLAIARTMATAGATVAVCGRDAGRVEQAAAALRELSDASFALQGDLARYEDAARIVDAAALRMGGPDADVVVAEVPPTRWHTVVALEVGCVLFEAKSGPYDAGRAKDFAPWAPAEGADEVPAYLARLVAGAMELMTLTPETEPR